jgi:spermidine synthase
MVPWETLASAVVPEGGGEIRLLRRGTELSIRVGAHELMNSRVHGSEEALADAAWAKLGDRKAPAVLVGGLGMGFTLAATLRGLPARGRVVVAELVPAVIEWNRGVIGEVAGNPLRDRRVTVVQGDVGPIVRSESAAWDAVLLDVDNGPRALSRPGNCRLYGPDGLADAYRALRPGGVLAIWSSGKDPGFKARLQRARFKVDETSVASRGPSGGAWHTLWIAVR